MLKKSLVITTINRYENTCLEDFKKYGYDIIVVGDLKTDQESYEEKGIEYIGPYDSEFDKFSKMLPYNHYCRKNLGYLRAIMNNSDIIFETDDDNYPIESFGNWEERTVYKKVSGVRYPNILKLYTNIDIWARGYPLEYINKDIKLLVDDIKEGEKVGIYQSLAEGDPDVDAIYRLTNKNYNQNIIFERDKGYILDKNCYTQGNTQGTFWVDKRLFHLLYIPCTVSFRYCDILKMYIAQRCMWEYDRLFCYISPVVRQNRNEHSYMGDFKSEYPMYISLVELLDDIFVGIKLKGERGDLREVYKKLFERGIVKEMELKLVDEWLNLVGFEMA